jgi:excisionase family DNA binding protein
MPYENNRRVSDPPPDYNSMAPKLEDPLLTVDDVAKMLGISSAWVRQHSCGLRRPEIPSVKLGKSVRFRRQKILDWIESMERGT